jgi:D-methionine transport system ATP-binding protein
MVYSDPLAEIRVDRLSVQSPGFAKTDLLRDVSFELRRGDRLAIVGASGSGKTTLLRSLNRLTEPTRGAIYLGNQPLSQIPVVSLRQQVVLVLQESKLLGMTVQQALEYPLQLRQMEQTLIQHRVGEWLERLQIPLDWLARSELQLSVGQRQLVAIARALVTSPRILLLDEPTAALDLGTAQRLLTVLTELTQTGEMTVLMVNHQLDLAAEFCTRVVHLQQGALVQDTVPDRINWEALRRSLIEAETAQTEAWE